MMTIDCYEKSLFEQQTPYLQWLKEREAKRKINRDKNKGKHMIRLPFFSCEESVETCLERVGVATQERADKLQDMDFILFTGENGFVDEDAEYFFSEYFSEHSNEQIVYADEDYLGSLQDIYGKEWQRVISQGHISMRIPGFTGVSHGLSRIIHRIL